MVRTPFWLGTVSMYFFFFFREQIQFVLHVFSICGLLVCGCVFACAVSDVVPGVVSCFSGPWANKEF